MEVCESLLQTPSPTDSIYYLSCCAVVRGAGARQHNGCWVLGAECLVLGAWHT